MRNILGVLALGILLVGAGCDIYGSGVSDTTEFTAALSGAAERPDPVDTDGTGTGTFTLNEDETELSYEISVSGLSGDTVAAHFHFAADGADGAGDVVFAITENVVNDGNGGSTAEGVWPLSAGDVQNIRLDYIYVNFHTDLNPGGEVRGNLAPAS